jgi:V8-like Glu-specific endopeptidase
LRTIRDHLGLSLAALLAFGVTAGMLVIASPKAAAAAKPASSAATTTIEAPMVLIRVTGLVKAASSPTGQAEVRLADGEIIAIPAADVARVMARAREDARSVASVPSASGNCGTSYVKLQEKPDYYPLQVTTGFTVKVPAISYHWKVIISGPDKYAHEYTASGGLLLRKSWNGTYDSPADEPEGEYHARVDKTSDAVLSTEGVCHSAGPSTEERLTTPDTPVSWTLSTKGSSTPASASLDESGKPGAFSPLFPGTVIGKDTRTQVTNTTVYPYRAIVFLRATFKSGLSLRCTGFLYAANIVATAGHCIDAKGLGQAVEV